MTEADAQQVFAAGWSETALHDAVPRLVDHVLELRRSAGAAGLGQGGLVELLAETHEVNVGFTKRLRALQVRDGVLELYRTNLKITALQADGSFNGDDLKFVAKGETAKGNLTIDGKGVVTAARVSLGAVAPTVLLVEAAAKADENVIPHLAGLTVRKVIVVPGRIVNIVAS